MPPGGCGKAALSHSAPAQPQPFSKKEGRGGVAPPESADRSTSCVGRRTVIARRGKSSPPRRRPATASQSAAPARLMLQGGARGFHEDFSGFSINGLIRLFAEPYLTRHLQDIDRRGLKLPELGRGSASRRDNVTKPGTRRRSCWLRCCRPGPARRPRRSPPLGRGGGAWMQGRIIAGERGSRIRLSRVSGLRSAFLAGGSPHAPAALGAPDDLVAATN